MALSTTLICTVLVQAVLHHRDILKHSYQLIGHWVIVSPRYYCPVITVCLYCCIPNPNPNSRSTDWYGAAVFNNCQHPRFSARQSTH